MDVAVLHWVGSFPWAGVGVLHYDRNAALVHAPAAYVVADFVVADFVVAVAVVVATAVVAVAAVVVAVEFVIYYKLLPL